MKRMLKSISTSSGALQGYQKLLAITAHNLSNMNTTAYREKKATFHDLPYRTLVERCLPNTPDAVNIPDSGKGGAISSITTSLQEGIPLPTGKQFDLNILGEGFFRVTKPDGSYAYTRDGNFNLDEQGNLILPGGALLDLPLGFAALERKVDLSAINITAQGVIYAPLLIDSGGEEEPVLQETDPDLVDELPAGMIILGEIHLYRFANSQGLSSIGDNFLLPSASSGPPLEGKPGEKGFGELQQGFLESSNVDLAKQMTELLRGQRFLQASVRAIITGDELWAISLNMLA
jgi:flagellar basal-body rod protein FlgG